MHRCVTKFMIDTCRYPTSQYANDFPFFHFLGRVVMNNEDRFFNFTELFISGSYAEFRIKPMLSCIGDIDIMTDYNKILAIPHGHTPPAVLPGHYQSTMYVFDIIDSHQPGYVYLRASYILTKTQNGSYIAEEIKKIKRMKHLFFLRITTPSFFYHVQRCRNSGSSTPLHESRNPRQLLSAVIADSHS